MKRTKRAFLLRPLAALVAALAVALAAAPVTALAEVLIPDTECAGSLTLVVKDADSKEAVTGGVVSVYRVAEVDNEDADAGKMGYVFRATDAFAGSGYEVFSADDLSADKAPATAADLASYAANAGAGATATGAMGETIDLSPAAGLYLVVQDEPATGYKSFAPFLVSLPQEEDGAYVYDVSSELKGVVVATVEPVTVGAMGVEKVVVGKDAPTDTPFQFELTARDGAPLPVGAEGYVKTVDSTMTVERAGAGKLALGQITFTEPGVYAYTLAEVAGSVEGYTYDDSVYYVEFTVAQEGDELVAKSVVRDGSATGEVLSDDASAYFCGFNNPYEKDEPAPEPEPKPNPEPRRMPQTSDIVYPVAGLVVVGATLAASGAVLRWRGKK